jgi:predicted acyltransferase
MRLRSLDFFRGLTVAFMILVNNPGTRSFIYPPLEHAPWHGCTPTDCVFPFFLFIVGVSFFFSSEKWGHQLSGAALQKILKRTAAIFGIGLLLNWFPFYNFEEGHFKLFENLRIFGVLQRIALSFCLGAIICLLFKKENLILSASGILLFYWAIFYFFGMSGGDPYALEGNAKQQLDLFLLGEKHLYHGFKNAAGVKIAFDPEGLLGMISGAVTVILGFLTGEHIRRRSDSLDLLARDLILFGLAIVSISLVFDLFFPINKPLWTSSYVLYVGGLAMIGLAGCIWVIDKRGWTVGTGPMIIFGSNPLFAFVLSGVLAKLGSIRWIKSGDEYKSTIGWIYKNGFVPIDAFKFGSLLYALFFVSVCFGFCYLLYRKGIFWKV